MVVYNFTQLGQSYYNMFPSGKFKILKLKIELKDYSLQVTTESHC